MRIPIYQVDAFTSQRFHGNPAAVCPLEVWLEDEVLQAIAAENNLSETAFFVRQGKAFALRWFTPTTEVDLCGHATLASAFVLAHCLGETADPLVFDSRGGTLKVARQGERLVLDFPCLPPTAEAVPTGVGEALGGAPQEVLMSRESTHHGNFLVVYGSAAEVAALAPEMAALEAFGQCGFIATAPGSTGSTGSSEDGVDFVSRYFAPAFGVPEDPVTGSTHCTLAPYWTDRLGRSPGDRLHARQISRRGGELTVRVQGDRVWIEGDAVLYFSGHLDGDFS
jgi:PhzF family phenazine biosynthesis protein